MAQNLRDRGYSSSMDGYNQQKKKQEAPVSTQRAAQLPKPKQTAKKADTSAQKKQTAAGIPVSAQRMSSAANSRAASASTDILTVQEFNRSTALQKSYGTYQNYLLGRRVTPGGFTSKPDTTNLLRNTYDLYKQAENRYHAAWDNLAQVSNEIQGVKPLTSGNPNPVPKNTRQSNGVPLWMDQGAQKRYQAAQGALDYAAKEYQRTWEGMQSVLQKQEELEKQWRSSIRGQEEIQQNIDDNNRAIAELNRAREQSGQKTASLLSENSMRGPDAALRLQQALNRRDEAERIDKQIEALRQDNALLQEELEWSHYFKWQDMANNELPASVRRVQGTPHAIDRIIMGNYTDEDVMQAVNEEFFDPNNVKQMSREERETYRKLYETYGPEKARAYYDELDTLMLNSRRRMAEEQSVRDLMQDNPAAVIGLNILSVLAGPLKAFTYANQAGEMLLHGKLTQDASYNQFSYLSSAVRDETSRQIGEKLGNTWGKFGVLGYQTAISMADFLYNAGITGGFSGGGENLSLLLMGSEAAADATMQAKDRGLDDGKAFTLGTIAGIAEIFTEKVSLETLLDKLGTKNGWQYFFKNFFAEGSEEVASDLINLMADIWIAKDQSEWRTTIRGYMKDGMSAQEAFNKAWLEQADAIMQSFAGGALSGGAMAGGMLMLNYNAYQKQAREAMTSPDYLKGIIEQGKLTGEGTQAYELAERLESKLEDGRHIGLHEVMNAERAAQKALEQDMKDRNAEALGQRLISTEYGREALKQEIQICIAGDINRALARTVMQQMQNGKEIEAKDAGKVFLAAQKVVESYQAEQQAREKGQQKLTPREVTADMTELEKSAAVIGVSERDTARMQRVSRALGREVRFYDRAPESYVRDGKRYTSTQNGYYDRESGILYVNARAKNPFMQVISHELTHALEGTESYGTLQGMILGQVEDLDQRIKDKIESYARQGVTLDEAGAKYELTAEYVENTLLGDERTIRETVRKNRSLGEWVRDQIDRILAKLGNAEEQAAAKERRELRRIRDIYARALRERSGNEKTAADVTNTSAEQFSFTEEIRDENIRAAATMKPVAELSGEEFAPGPIDLITQVSTFFDSIGNSVDTKQIGAVELNRRGIKADIGHGIGRKKAAAFQAVPDILKNGEVIDYAVNWKNRNYDTIVFAAPITIAGEPYMAGAIALKDSDGSRFYLHEVLIEKEGQTPFKTGTNNSASVPGGAYPSLMSLLRKVVDVKNNIGKVDNTQSSMTEEAVEPMGLSLPMIGDAQSSLTEEAEGPKDLSLPMVDDGKQQFSMSEEVEQAGTLVALHNLSADKLTKALKLGGFPMPSIAVTRRNIPHTNFGPITLVMDKSTVDPQASVRNKTYSADVWSPTFPEIEYEADSKITRNIRSKYYELYQKYGDEATRPLYDWANYPDDALKRRGGEAGVIRSFEDDTDMMRLYLLDTQGKTVEKVTEETVERLPQYLIDSYERMAELMGEDAFRELKTENGENPREARKRWWEKYGEQYEAARKQELLEKGMAEADIDAYLENETIAAHTMQAIRIRNYLLNGAEKRTQNVNITKSNAAVRAQVDPEGYSAWLHGLFDGIEKGQGVYNGRDYYNDNGDRRSFRQTHYPVTLENIARAMAAQNNGETKNVSGFHGVKSLRANTALEFKSIDEMHENEGRLRHLSEEEAGQISDTLNKRLLELIYEIYNSRPHGKYENQFIETDSIGEMISAAAEDGAKTVADIRRAFDGSGYTVDVQTASDLLNLFDEVAQMPVNLFEAKPNRAVRFDEVLAAVVPQGTSRELIDGLREAGVQNVMEYEPENTEDRMAKVNSVQNAAFSYSEAEDGPIELSLPMVNDGAGVTASDVAALRNLSSRHISELTSDELQRLTPWARKFQTELKEKSPFFRAWFGDWRSADTSGVNVPAVQSNTIQKAAAGKVVNDDTGKTISWGDQVFRETKIHAGKQSAAPYVLGNIQQIAKSAVLLDSEISESTSKSKMNNTAFMHNFYALCDYNGNLHLLKLYAEEALDNRGKDVFTRAYEIKDIKEIAPVAKGVHSKGGLTQATNAKSGYSVADLYALVKQYDRDFKARPSSKIVNADGTPRVVYHGTNTGEFWEFNPDYIGMSSGDDGFFGRGFYFAYTKGEAGWYGARRIIPAYLNIRNPFNFQKEIYSYNGERAYGGDSPNAIAMINFADKFPEIAKNITVYKNNGEISAAKFAEELKDVIANKKFQYQDITDPYTGDKMTLITADEKTYSFEVNGEQRTGRYAEFQKRFYGKVNPLEAAVEYMHDRRGVEAIPSVTSVILDHNPEFTQTLKDRGYDGVIQSEEGDEVVAFYPNQIKSATDNVGTFDRNNPDIRYSMTEEEDGPVGLELPKIEAGDGEHIYRDAPENYRYNVLKDKTLTVQSYDPAKLEDVDLSQFDTLNKSDTEKLLRKIGEQFGVFKTYSNRDVAVEFNFSRNNLGESLHKQDGNYGDYAKMLTVFGDVVENAVGIEVHSERYANKGSQLKQMYVLASAFKTEDGIIPVLMEVKEFSDRTQHALHLTVSLNAITEADIVAYTHAPEEGAMSYTPSASAYRVADIFRNVNAADGNMLKYVPDGFLTDEQRAAKQKALEQTEQYIAEKNRRRYSKFSYTETEDGPIGLSLPMVGDTDGRMRASAPTEAPEVKGLELPVVEDEKNRADYTESSWMRYLTAKKAAQYMIDNARDDFERADGRDAMKAAEKLLQKKTAGKGPAEIERSNPVESTRRLTSRLFDLFQIEQMDRAEMRKYISEFAQEVLEKGEVTDTDLGQLWSKLRYFARGTVETQEQAHYQAIRETLNGAKIHVDESTRADFGDDYGYWRRRAFANGIYLTSDTRNRDARDFMPELNNAFAERFPEDMTDPRKIIETMVETAELAKSRTVPLDEYLKWNEQQTGQTASEKEDELWDQTRRAVDSFLDAATVEQALRGRKTLKTDEEAEEKYQARDLVGQVYQMSDAALDAAIDLMEEPRKAEAPEPAAAKAEPAAAKAEAPQTEDEYLESLLADAERRIARSDDPAGAFLDAYTQLTGEQTEIIPGMEKISTGTKQQAKNKPKGGVREAWRFFYRKMVDSGEAVARLGKYAGDRHLYHYYNMARASSNAAVAMIQNEQTDVMGHKAGESLNSIFKTIRAKGQDYYANLQAYLYHMHNIDRMSRENPGAILQAQEELEQFRRDNPEIAKLADYQIEAIAGDSTSALSEQAQLYSEILERMRRAEMTRNKPMFDPTIDAEISQRAAAELREKLEQTEGFEEDVQRIYDYIDNLMRYRIDSGLITEEDYQKLKGIYPHYVPTYREMEREQTRSRRKNRTEIGKTVGRAEGGDQRLMPLHKALAQQTFSVVREGSKNRFGQMLLDGKQQSSRGMIKDIQKYSGDFHEDTFDQDEDPAFKKTNSFIVRENGQRWELTLDNALYEAVDVLSPEPQESNLLTRVIRGGNDLFKALCTGYNPTFLARNFMRDLQDAGLYSRDLSEFSKNYPLAYREIATNGKYWRQYKALGGLYSSVFDYQTGELKQSGKLKRYTADKIEALNMAVEQAPRLAEFMATVKKAERAGTLDMNTLMEAMYNAADVTVNFGRSGKIGQNLNRNFVPFLNPGIQGFDKMVRNVSETKGFKDWTRLTAKAALLGIAPAVLSRLLFGKRKDWDEIKQRDKDIYYLFPLDDDGHWLKLPKGRTLSILGMAADRTMSQIEGKDTDWIGMLTTSASQVAPANPLTNNIYQPIVGTKLFNPDNPGETWYGGDIESQRLRNLKPSERYDASTSEISKFLGRTFNLSPAKINYLLDQYTGALGDIILPLTSARAEKDMFSAAFTVDTATSNQLSGDFYDTLDELTYQKNDPKADPESAAIYKFFNKQVSDVSEINKAIRAIEEDDSLSNREKQELTRVQYALRNEVMRNALGNLDQYSEAAKNAYAATGDADEAYREANREMFGAEYALRIYSKDISEKAAQWNAEQGVSYDDFYTYYFAAKDLQKQGYKDNQAMYRTLADMDADDSVKEAIFKAEKGAEAENKSGLTAYGKMQWAGKNGISTGKYLDWLAQFEGDPDQKEMLEALAAANYSDKEKLTLAGTIFSKPDLEDKDGDETKYGTIVTASRNGVKVNDILKVVSEDAVAEYRHAVKAGLKPEYAVDAAQTGHAIKERVIEERRAEGLDDGDWLDYCIEAVLTVNDPDEKLEALAALMESSNFDKCWDCLDLIEPDLYVEAYARVEDVKAKYGKTSLNQDMAIEALNQMDCTAAEKGILFHMLNKGWKSTKNNPFDKAAGQRAIDAMNANTEEPQGLNLPYIP